MNALICVLGWGAVGAFVWFLRHADKESKQPEVSTYAKHRLFDSEDGGLVGEVTEVNEVMTSVRFSKEMEPYL